jgi:hypothetical protein
MIFRLKPTDAVATLGWIQKTGLRKQREMLISKNIHGRKNSKKNVITIVDIV